MTVPADDATAGVVSSASTLVVGGTVHTGRRTLPKGWVLFEAGTVRAVGAAAPPPSAVRRAATSVDATGCRIVPGFVDVHCHGGGGRQFGGAGDDAIEAARIVARTHLVHGTTTLVASLVSAPPAEMHASVCALAELVQDGELAGVHLEGPWLSPARRGAHDPRQLRVPEPADVDHLLTGGGGAVRCVTIAPELPGGLDAVRRITGAGAVAAIGHTDADEKQTRAAVEAGVRAATHLWNAMPPVHHRAPGPVPTLLHDARVAVELIADGVHVHPDVLRLAAAVAGPARTVLVTDAMAAAGCGDGTYPLGELDVVVRDGVAMLADGSSIAGSTLTLDRALRFAVQAGSSFAEALAAVTTVPAGLLGRPDLGHLEPGATGGAVVVDDDMRVRRVVHRTG